MSRALWSTVCAALVLAHAFPVRGQGTVPSIVSSARIDPARDINFSSEVSPARVYVGQQVTYQIGIFLTGDMRARLRSNPQFVPPDVRSAIAYDLPAPARLGRRTEGQRTWDVHVFSRALFPVSAGAVEIAPARLSYQVPLSASIFSREESHSARSLPHKVTVIEPPQAARPAGYTGAVGRLSIRARADAASARVGDPFVLTVTVEGVGNVGLFPRPALNLLWGHAVEGPERVVVDSSSTMVAGEKAFEWVVTPREPGSQVVPEIRYPYFNPYTERYEIAVARSLDVRVQPGGLAGVQADVPIVDPRLSLRRVLGDDVSPPWSASPWFWLLLLSMPVPLALQRWRERPRVVQRASAEDRLRAIAAAVVPDVRELRRSTHAVLSRRVPRARNGSALEGLALERTLRRAGVSATTAQDARRVLAELDESAYSLERTAAPDLARRVLHVMEAIDKEAVSPTRMPRGVALLMLAGAFGARVLVGQGGNDTPTQWFADAVAAYDAGRAAEARDLFLKVGAVRPRSADTWANAGTSAWEGGDTVTAVMGWQRALRLEPMASDVRQRLRATPTFRDGWLGDVTPAPVNLLAVVGGVLWLAGWGMGWRLRGMTRPAWLTLSAALLIALAAVAQAERLTGARAVVVRERDVLRDAPAVAARATANVLAGETAHVAHAQGTWSRIRLADGREGWAEARSLVSLEVPPAR